MVGNKLCLLQQSTSLVLKMLFLSYKKKSQWGSVEWVRKCLFTSFTSLPTNSTKLCKDLKEALLVGKILPSNLYVAHILYSRHLTITDRFYSNWPSPSQTLLAKRLYSRHFFNGHSL